MICQFLLGLFHYYQFSNFGLYRCKFSRVEKPDAATMRRIAVSPAALQEHLKASGFEIVHWHGRCDPDELLQGHYEVLTGMEGTYALFFDNTFSKNTAKTVLFSQRIMSLITQLNSPVHSSVGSSFESNGNTNMLQTPSKTNGDNSATITSSSGSSVNGLAPPKAILPNSKPTDRQSMIDLSFEKKSRPISVYTEANVPIDSQPPPSMPTIDPAIIARNNALNILGSGSDTSTRNNSLNDSSDLKKSNLHSGSSLAVAMRSTSDARKSSVTITTQSLEKRNPNRSTCITDGRYVRGILLKKRRKKLQGYARRYFSLDFKYGTFNYYLSEKNSILRGSMPIKICAISAKSSSREIFVDSGMEVWNLKALSLADFQAWTEAFDTARVTTSQQTNGKRWSKTPNNLLKASLHANAGLSDLNQFDFTNFHRKDVHSEPASDGFEGIADVIKKLEAISSKAKEEAGGKDESASQDKVVPLSNSQRRASFWRRRSSKHAQNTPFNENESTDPLVKNQRNLSATSATDLSTLSPPMPQPSLISDDLLKSGSAEEISKINLNSTPLNTTVPVVPKESDSSGNLNGTTLNSHTASAAFLDISQSIDGVIDDLKIILNKRFQSMEKNATQEPNSLSAVARASVMAVALGTPYTEQDLNHNTAAETNYVMGMAVSSVSPGDSGFDLDKEPSSASANTVVRRPASSAYINPMNRMSDNLSLLSTDEFYDAQEFNKTDDGVVYIDKEDISESSEDEVVETGDKLADEMDDSLSESDEDEEEDVTVHTHIVPVASDLAEVENVDGEPHLYPLEEISTPPKRRIAIPPAAVAPPSLISLVRKSVGKDLSTIAMPVSTNEPITILQRMCEMFEYTELIDAAFKYPEGSAERLMMVALFANSYLSSGRVKDRATRKPFNPLLGETFELVRPEQGIRVVSEKVSHRPPVMAIQAESASWVFQYSPNPHQQFWGKSAEINNRGTARLSHLPSGEVYEWEQPTTFLRNVIAGEKYVEPVGSLVVVTSNGSKASIEYKSGSMFSGRSEELKAVLHDPKGNVMKGYSLDGRWTQSIDMTADGKSKGKVWEVGKLVNNPSKHFGFTQFAASLNEITSIEKGHMAPTDSRLRPDQRVYEEGDVDNAETWKLQLEENQRQRRKHMEENNITYQPKFFEFDEKESIWKLMAGDKNYWRRRRIGDWTPNGLDDLFTL